MWQNVRRYRNQHKSLLTWIALMRLKKLAREKTDGQPPAVLRILPWRQWPRCRRLARDRLDRCDCQATAAETPRGRAIPKQGQLRWARKSNRKPSLRW